MEKNVNAKFKTNDFITKIIKAKPKKKTSIDQQDSESLNTMDYYNEDSSTKNSLIADIKLNNHFLNNPIKLDKIQTIEYTDKNDISNQNQKTNQANKTSENIYKNIKITRRKNSINIQKKQKLSNLIHNICSKCFADIGNSYMICIKCKKCFCQKCFQGNFGKNLVNNKNKNYINKEKNLTERNEVICYYCSNDGIIDKKYYKNRMIEPLDSYSDNEMKNVTEKKVTKNKREQSVKKMNSLKEKMNEYDDFLDKINDSKNEIEIKKNICFNILQMINKAIEIEYNKILNKLNELSIKLKKIKEDLNKTINNPENLYKSEIELQINIDTYKSTLKSFSKIFDNYSQKIISRTIFRGFKLYESQNILINYSETYFMKDKEILSDLPFGNVFLKVDRHVNNFVNYFNFTTLIKQKKKNISNDFMNNTFQNEVNNKPRFIVNMIVNNKLIRLNKTNKDNNDINVSYESSEEENRIFSKEKYNLYNNKQKNLNIKVIISEILL